MKQKVKLNSNIVLIVVFFILNLSFGQASTPSLTTPASQLAEELIASDAVEKDWKVFEGTVNNFLTSQSKKYATQVYLDVYIDNGKIPTRIIADVLLLVGTKYQVVDAKASQTKDLVGISTLQNVCTRNQKIVYPALNLLTGSGTITKVEVKGGANLGNITLQLGSVITNTIVKTSKQGVLFYVTKPAANYTGTPGARFLELL